jgi:hypothetical protein
MDDADYQSFATHRVILRNDILCADDETAKEQAKRMVDGHAVELWCEARKIAKFTPEK